MKKLIFFIFLFFSLVYAIDNINEVEPNDYVIHATSININQEGIGNLDYNKSDTSDWWKFTPSNNGFLTITITLKNPSSVVEAFLGRQIGSFIFPVSSSKGSNEIVFKTYVYANTTYYLYLGLDTKNSTDYNISFYQKIEYDYSGINTANFHPIFNKNLNGKLNVIGNHNVCYTNGTNQCLNPGNADNNNIDQSYINVDSEAIKDKYINSSEADLNLKNNDKIIKAYLFWQGRIKTNYPNNDNAVKNANKVELRTPTTNGYVEIDANSTSFNWYYGSDGVFDYGAYADVTKYVQKSGQYYVANLQVSQGYNTGGGWSLVVITKNPYDKFKKIVVYEGFQAIYNQLGYPNSVTQTLSGFFTPTTGTVNANFIFFANETDRSLNDYVTLTDKYGNTHKLTNVLNPPDNVLNCTISKFGENVVNRNPNFENTLGTDIDEFDVSNIFNNEQTQTQITITSEGDRIFLNMFAISVQLYVPKVCYYDFKLYDKNGNLILPGSKLLVGNKIKVKFKVKNDENETAKNVYIIYPFDENNNTKYENNSTYVKNVLQSNYEHFDDNTTIGNLGVYVDNKSLSIGILGDNNNEFISYYENPNYVAGIEFNSTIQNEGNLTFVFYTDYNYTIGNENYSYNGVLPKCNIFANNYYVYNPGQGVFNVVHYQPDITYDPKDVNNSINDLYTQIVNKDFNVTVVKLKDDNQTVDKNFKGIVEVDLINNPDNVNDYLNSPSLWHQFVIFNNNTPTLKVKYDKANRNVRFRIKYLTDGNGNIIQDTNNACLSKTYNCIWGLLTQIATSRYGNACPTTSNSAEYCDIPCAKECNYRQNRVEGGGEVPSEECLECIFNNYSSSITSRDNFAVRPYAFLAFGENQYKRAGEDFNITIKAVDEENYNKIVGNVNDIKGVKDYNVSINDLNISSNFYIPSEDEIKQMNKDVYGVEDNNISKVAYCPDKGVFTIVKGNAFVNGEINTTMSYSESGILSLKISEINGSEFAKVDEKDTPDDKRFIKPATVIINENNLSQRNLLLEFIPYKIITTGTYGSTTNSFVYMNNINNLIIPKMAAYIEYNITAENKNGKILKNFTKTCYPDTSIHAPTRNGLKLNTTFDLLLNANLYTTSDANISFSNIDLRDNSHIWLLNPKLNIKKGINNITQWISSLNFENGEGKVKLFFNIDKNYTNPINEMNMTLLDINTSTTWMNQKGATKIFIGKSINKLINFKYGRIDVTDVSGYGNELNSKFKYEYWNNKSGWVINKDHNSSIFGDVNINNSYHPYVNIKLSNIKNGDENVTFSTTHALPYSTKVHLSIPSWLWYHPLAKPYKDPKTSTGWNLDCLTHPCFNISFQKNSSGWGGVQSNINKKYSEQNRTVESNSSIKVNKRTLKKINW